MRLILGLLVLGVLTLVGSRLSFGRDGRRVVKGRLAGHPAVRYFLWSGGVFVLMGVLLGPSLLGVLDEATLADLRPLVVLGLGWIGFLLGLRFRLADWSRLRPKLLVTALSQGVVAFGVLLGVGWLALGALGPWFWPGEREFFGGGQMHLAALTMFSLVGAASSQTLVGLLAKEHLLQPGPVVEWLRQATALDTLVPMAGLGMLMALEPVMIPPPHLIAEVVTPTATAWRLVETPAWLPWVWPFVAVGLGVAMGGIFLLVLQEDPPREALLVATVGMIVLGSGGAYYMGLSPLFSNFVMGFTFANLAPQDQRVMGLISHWERLMYIVFLILAGSLWAGRGLGQALVVVVPYVVLRLGARLVGAFVVTRAMGKHHLPPLVGLGLMGQGGLAVALAVALTLQNPGWSPGWVLGACLMGLMVNDLTSPWLLPRLLETGSPETGGLAAKEHNAGEGGS